ncbi:hypothetical protein [Pseudonocardia sp. T1-2H]|uniref:hypothetical protein n=1 Tax=Pseudonocardia sp. T1-2H TaxID=3128899 RepID=UPI003100B26F
MMIRTAQESGQEIGFRRNQVRVIVDRATGTEAIERPTHHATPELGGAPDPSCAVVPLMT